MIFFFFLLKIRGSQHLGPHFRRAKFGEGGLEREEYSMQTGFYSTSAESHASSHV